MFSNVIFESEKLKKFLQIGEDKNIKEARYRLFVFLLIFECILYFSFFYFRFLAYLIFAAAFIFSLISLLVSLLFMMLIEDKFSTRMTKLLKKWTLILITVTISGVLSAYYIFFLNGNLSIFIIASGYIYFTMIIPIIPSVQKISQYERKNTIEKLEKSVNKSPTFVIITSIEDLKEIKGKIIDPYNPMYLKIRSGKRTFSIPWEKIEAIGEE
jgi:hypothetical protein